MENNTDSSMILLNIRGKYSSLNPALKRIADFFLNHYHDAAYMSISEVANQSGVSESTVTRFIKEIDYPNSFKAFQVDLACSIRAGNERNIPVYGGINAGDNTKMICEKVFYCNMMAMQDSLKLMDFNSIEKASELILKASSVIFYGSGRSSITASNGRFRLYRLGIKAFAYNDSQEQTLTASLVTPEDVVIGISNSGCSSSVVRNIKRAREQGASTIGITSHQDSPLAKTAEITLYSATNDPETSTVEPSCATVSQMVILDCLYMSVMMKTLDKSLEYENITEQALKEEKM